MFAFFVILIIAVSALIVVFSLRAYRNPRNEWERKHASEMKGGEPTAEALTRIQRNALLGMIFGPIIVTMTGIAGYLRFEKEAADRARLQQQAERDSPMFRQFGNLSKIKRGMSTAEVVAIMGPGHRSV